MLCFNSRAREGRDPDYDLYKDYANVSIHAPAKGATYYRQGKVAEICFNSRAREGRDIGEDALTLGVEVSIHAPAKGATQLVVKDSKVEGFQFTRPRRARQWIF